MEKLGHDLVVPGDPDARYRVAEGVLGYTRRLPRVGPVVPTVGAAVNVGFIAEELQPTYGARFPLGAFLFVGLQPPRLETTHHMRHSMEDM